MGAHQNLPQALPSEGEMIPLQAAGSQGEATRRLGTDMEQCL